MHRQPRRSRPRRIRKSRGATGHERTRDARTNSPGLASPPSRIAAPLSGVAIALGPTLLAEAAAVLGVYEEESADVLQDFFLLLLEGRLRFSPADGPALPWMCRGVRQLAKLRREERERDWGKEDDG